MKDKEIKIRCGKNSFVHPSYIDYCMTTSKVDWNEDAQTEAIRIWQLCFLFPNLEAGVLIDLVKGKRKYSYDDETIYIHVEEEEE
tara:strand:- start:3999 stop:4253 length:255 start_codon:yes stop_codon:yes gene_type:complete